MPASWVRDEDIWEKAKKEVDKGDLSEDAYWGSVAEVYKNMGGRKKKSQVEVLDSIAMSLHNQGYKRLAFRLCEVRDKLALVWTEEQEEKFEKWKAIYEKKWPPEKIDEARKMWEEKGMGRQPLPGEPRFKEPNPTVAPAPQVEEADPPSPSPKRETFDDWETHSWEEYHRYEQMSEEDKAQWRAEHGGRPPQYHKPSIREVRNPESSRRADLDPSGGEIPDPADPVVLELMGYDTYQGSDPMSGPGIAVKMEGGQFQVYVIEDPDQEFYGEIYLSRADDRSWGIDYVDERLQPGSQSIIPPQWHEGYVLPDEELKDWLANESARF